MEAEMLDWCRSPSVWFWLIGLVAAPAAMAQQTLDLALVIAVDVSSSMTHEEQEFQRDSFVETFRSPQIHKAMQKGALGRIAVTYVEWSGKDDQTILVRPWMEPPLLWHLRRNSPHNPCGRAGRPQSRA
jgi:hypothetical protein